jgi:glycosyltransferase involved in cell wall biosynthesis
MPRTRPALLPVAIEASALCTPRPSGVARYTRELATALLALAARGETPYDFLLAYRLSRWRERGRCLEGAPRLWYQEPLPPPGPRPLLVHGTDLRVPAWRGVPGVATLHDVFALLSDAWSPPAFRARKIAAYRALPARCARIVAVSEATRRDFLERVACPPERVVVVHEGVSPSFAPPTPAARAAVLARYGLEGGPPYLLFVGGIDRRKNLRGLLRALLAEPALADFRLAVVGGEGHGAAELLGDPTWRALAPRLLRLGVVPDADLPALYAGAAAFCMPSFAEGFGLPLLEAMACGTPVMAADRGALPEVAGGHARLADPASPGAIGAAILHALAATPAEREAARAHAAQFTWESTARGMLQVYAESLGEPRTQAEL